MKRVYKEYRVAYVFLLVIFVGLLFSCKMNKSKFISINNLKLYEDGYWSINDYFELDDINEIKKEDIDRAIADYTEMLQEQDFYFIFPILYLIRGNAYHYNKDYDHAITDYTKAIQINPYYVTAYYDRGYAYYNKGKYFNAMVDLYKAIWLDPYIDITYKNRDFVMDINKEDYDRAIVDLNQAIRLDPYIANYYRHRAFTYMKKGNYRQARADVNKALQINPNYTSAQELSNELKQFGY